MDATKMDTLRALQDAEARAHRATNLLRALVNIPAVKQALGTHHTLGCECPYCNAQRFLP